MSCLASSATGYVNLIITSTLEESGRTHACPGEHVTYTCETNGTLLTWIVPPYINESTAVSFLPGNPNGTTFLSVPEARILLFTNRPTLLSQMTVKQSDRFTLSSTSVTCRTSDNQSKSLPYRLSGKFVSGAKLYVITSRDNFKHKFTSINLMIKAIRGVVFVYDVMFLLVNIMIFMNKLRRFSSATIFHTKSGSRI